MDRENIQEHWYWEVTLACPHSVADLLSFYLFENGAVGIQELEAEKEQTRFKGFFLPSSESLKARLDSAIRQIERERDTIRIGTIQRKRMENWQENWQKYFKPLPVGGKFVIRPPWEPPSTDRKEIVIQPGQGFGTGYHESTRLALEMLEWAGEQTPLRSVLDVGTGSGILAIASLLLGAQRVTAIDIDTASVAEVPQNLQLSGLAKNSVCLLCQSPAHLKQTADMVIANIVAETILTISDDLKRLTLTGGFLIVSGIVLEMRRKVASRFQTAMTLVHTLCRGEWCSLAFRKDRKIEAR